MLKGFSGQLLLGLRLGRDPSLSANIEFPGWIEELLTSGGNAAHTEDCDVEVDEVTAEVGHLAEFVANLSV